jgi:hypothetical protein
MDGFEKLDEKTLQKTLWGRLIFLAGMIVCNSLLAGFWVYFRSDELLDYNIFTIFLDIWYFILMLPSLIAALCSRWRWELLALCALLYIIIIWIAYGTLNC